MHVGPEGRRSGGLRPAFQEKFVSVYEHIFAGSSPIQSAREEGFVGRQALNRFWDELLLLKVNEAYLAQRIAQLSEAEVVGPLKSTFNHLFSSCARYRLRFAAMCVAEAESRGVRVADTSAIAISSALPTLWKHWRCF